MAKKAQTPKNQKKGAKILSKILDLFFHKKKAPAATPPAEKTCFLLIKNLYGKKIPNPKKGSKKLSNILDPFFCTKKKRLH